jgi:type I restriction enzyme S subunit
MTEATRNLLEQHFDTAFAAPDGVAKLRELILTLAMQGKLVAQDPNDSPASELLKEIEVDKKRQVKAGKIKKPKSLPAIDQSDAAYVLPQSWAWTHLGTIGNIFNGNSINAREKETKYTGANGLPYIATKDVGYGLDTLDYKNGIYIPESEEKFKIAHQGAVLICAEGGSAGKKCGITEQDICFGNKLFANELFGGIPSKFILYLYLSPVFRESFSAAMTGIIGGISIAKFLELPAPLPPLEEQHRIVARIDQLMALCDALEKQRKEREEMRLAVHAAAIKQLLDQPDSSTWKFIQQHFGEIYAVKENVAELRKAILQLAVMGRLVPQDPNDPPASELLKEIEAEKQRLVKAGKIKMPKPLPAIKLEDTPYKLPQGWEWVRLGSICSYIQRGKGPSYVDISSHRVISQKCVRWYGLDLAPARYIDPTSLNKYESIRFLKVGDLLWNSTGTGTIGRACIVPQELEGVKIVADSHVTVIRTIEVSQAFLWRWIQSPTIQDEIESSASGTTNQIELNTSTIINYLMPLPPLPEQHRIVARIDQLMALCDRLDQQIDAATGKQTELLNAVMAQV